MFVIIVGNKFLPIFHLGASRNSLWGKTYVSNEQLGSFKKSFGPLRQCNKH